MRCDIQNCGNPPSNVICHPVKLLSLLLKSTEHVFPGSSQCLLNSTLSAVFSSERQITKNLYKIYSPLGSSAVLIPKK